MSTTKKQPVKPKTGEQKQKVKDNSMVQSIERGTKPGEARKAYILSTELTSKIDAIAFWDRRNIKEVATDALSSYVAAWEKKNGPVKLPGKK